MAIYRTIGIDASLTNTGLCYIENDAGAITRSSKVVVPPSEMRGHPRLDFIDRLVRDFLSESPANLVVIEGYDYKGFSTIPLAEINGILQLTAFRICGRVIHAAPAQVKKFATGKSQASKEMIMKHYGLDNEHIADARALAEIGQIFLGAPTTRRCELEVAYALRQGKVSKATAAKAPRSKLKLVAL
jgi:Holliday junction resolvasome RuvABC endonuclease subunit